VRFIDANAAPAELINWVAQQGAAGVNLCYDNLGQIEIGGQIHDVKEAIKGQRLRDQGFLCAYTLLRIDQNSAHIEHLVPRATSNANGVPEQTVEYGNMVACFPLNGGDKSHGFGAPVRGTTPLVVTPRQQNCATFFKFTPNGRVEPAQPGNFAVRTMIDEVLCLNAPLLVSRRLAAYRGVRLSLDSPHPLSRAAAERLQRDVLTHKAGGRLTPFCICIAEAAGDHIRRLEKLSARKRFSRQQLRD
jgi:uncharacterized protein (TIGR02646 family)